MKKLIYQFIKIYKTVSIFLRAVNFPIFIYTECKFHPTCSDYARESINKHGTFRGTLKTILRILKCSPLSKGGLDIP